MKDELIKTLLMLNIPIELKLENGYVMYDINTGAKSHAYLDFASNEKDIVVHQRYGEVSYISKDKDLDNIIEDLCWIVRSCMCGREYVAKHWLKLFTEFGIVEVEEKVTKVYKW